MYEIKKTEEDMKSSLTKIEKSQKKESSRNPGNKNFLKSNKKYS
jgi:hypothetical protein